jgi:CAAX protease family protein
MQKKNGGTTTAHSAIAGPDPATEKLGLWAVIALVFLFSWPSAIPQIMASWKGAAAVPGWVKALQFLIIAPALVVIAAAWINGGWPAARALLGRIIRWRAAPFLYVAVLLGPPLVIWSCAWLSKQLGLMDRDVTNVPAILSAFAPSFLVYLLLNTEEIAWRGYVLPRMQAWWTPLRASLVLGVTWTAFHVPYFFMKGGHPGGLTPLLFIVMVMSMTIVMTSVFNASAGSVLLPHLFHQSVNAWVEVIPSLPRFTGSRWPFVFGVIVLLICAIALAMRPAMRLPEHS